MGCHAVEDAGAYTFIDAGLTGYWRHFIGVSHLAQRSAIRYMLWLMSRLTGCRRCSALTAAATRCGNTLGFDILAFEDS